MAKEIIESGNLYFFVYGNAQVLLIGARKQNIQEELGIEFKREGASQAVDRLYSALHMSEEDHPSKPLIEGQWPETKEVA